MGNSEKATSFQIVRRAVSFSLLALSCLVAVLLMPSHPSREATSHPVEQVEGSTGKLDHELFRIYSVIKSRRMDLTDASAWAISEAILTESIRNSLDPLLVLAVIEVESRFQHAVVSNMGARGLMQIRPALAIALVNEVDLGDKFVDGELDPEALDDPILNIKLGVFYLQHLKTRFRDLKLALTAYNWGPTEINNRLSMEEEVPLEYAMKVLSTYQSFRHPPRHGLNRP